MDPSINPSTQEHVLDPWVGGYPGAWSGLAGGIWELEQQEWLGQSEKQGWGLVSSISRARSFPPNPGVCSAFLHLPFPTLEVKNKGL